MIDYTPSKEQVRDAYVQSREWSYFCDEDWREIANAEFDRFLVEYLNEVHDGKHG